MLSLMLTAVLKAVKMLISCCPNKNNQDAVVLTALKAVQDTVLTALKAVQDTEKKNHLYKDQVQRLIPIRNGSRE
jgi:hypothetical protein